MSSSLKPQELAKDKKFGLTKKELQVLREARANVTDAEIARKLGMGTRTVNAHMNSIRIKLHVTNRRAAVQFAVEHGLI